MKSHCTVPEGKHVLVFVHLTVDDTCNQSSVFSSCFFSFVDDDEHEWIVRTCRKGWDEYVGYQGGPNV